METSCVVTGGARGIGRGIAELMVARGHRVLVTDVDGDAATATAAEIGAAEGLTHDVRDPVAHRAVAEAAARHGVLTAWFNNAGVGDDGRLSENSEEQVRRLVEVNLLGVLWGIRTALTAFGKRGGDVVNTASLAGLGPVPGYAVYAATKAGVVSITMSADAETPRGVRVHAVCPDVVATAMLVEGHTAGSLGTQVARAGRVEAGDRLRAAAPRWADAGLGDRAGGLAARDGRGGGAGASHDRPQWEVGTLRRWFRPRAKFERLFGVALVPVGGRGYLRTHVRSNV